MRAEAVYKISVYTEKGPNKAVNQDSLMVKHGSCPCGEVVMAAVCDGCGGMEKGGFASRYVVKVFSEWFDEEMKSSALSEGISEIPEKWNVLIRNAHSKLRSLSSWDSGGTATTFSGILVLGNDFLIAHVGDSRIYEVGNSLAQLSIDHSPVGDRLRRGLITREEARYAKDRNVISQCIGAGAAPGPQILSGKTEGRGFLLCSDGLVHELSEDEIKQIISNAEKVKNEGSEFIARALVAEARQRGERDDISAIYIYR